MVRGKVVRVECIELQGGRELEVHGKWLKGKKRTALFVE